MFQEYPKWIYPGGDAARGVKVHSAAEEAALIPKAVETKVYADGTTGTGPAPLPEDSPADPLAGMTDEAVREYAKAQGVRLQGMHLMKGDNLRAKVRAALAE